MQNECENYLDLAPVIFFKWSNEPNWPVLHVSENVKTLLGYDKELFLNHTISYESIIFKEDMPRVFEEMASHITKLSPEFVHAPYRLVKADGKIIWVEDKTYVRRNMYGEIDYFYGYITDITKLKEIEIDRNSYLKLIEKNNQEHIHTINNLQAYKNILDEANIVSMSDLEGNITYANEAFFLVSGYTKEEVLGKPHNIIRHPDTPKSVFQGMWQTIQKKQIWKGSLKNKRKDGTPFYVNVTIAPLLDANRNIEKYISVRHNITSLILKSDELKQQAITDVLTGLGNRFKLLHDKEKMDKPCLALFDIIRFSQINDFYGYQIGDSLIKELSANLASFQDERYTLYRMYADQFAILGDGNDALTFEMSMRQWQIYLNQTPLHVNTEEIFVDVLCVLSYEASDMLLTTADITKNYAKMHRLQFHIYDKDIELSKAYEKNLYWQKRLKNALLEDAIVPYFQAIMDIKTRKITKYEALVRMTTENEVISPFQFLEVAKKTNQYSAITRIMIEKSCAYFASTQLQCSINLTLEDIKNHDTVAFLWESIERYGMENRLILEIVESEEIENVKEITPFLENARAYGCKISIDDFGTGYSNFSYLIKLHSHSIKIDGSIIKELLNPLSGASDVVEAIVTFAKARGMRTVAEFVSSQELFDAVEALGIDYAQGYFIAQPMPFERLKEV